MPWTDILIVLLICFSLLTLVMYYLLKGKYKEVLSFRDLLSQAPQPLNVNIDDLNEIIGTIEQRHIIEKLYILRALLGSNYRCMIKVTGNQIVLEHTSQLYINEEDDSEQKARDYTG